MESQEWYLHPKYQHYWNHYESMKEWYRTNRSQFWQIYRPLLPDDCVRHHCHHQQSYRCSKPQSTAFNAPRYATKREDVVDNASHVDRLSDDDIEMELTEEMIEFLKQSAKHRQERDAKREEEKRSNKAKDKAQESCGTSHLPPKVRPGVQRTAEMKMLYGKDAAMIHGMETAMQLTFDRNCDLMQPKLWPQLPLKLTFTD